MQTNTMQVCPELLLELKGISYLLMQMVPAHSPTSVKKGPKQTQTKNESSQETRRAWDEKEGVLMVSHGLLNFLVI